MVFRNHRGDILLITAGSLGHIINNAAELWGLTRGLQLAMEHNFNKLIVEGDSQVILNLFRKVLNGADPEQISPCWRLSHGLRTIATLLQPNQAFIPSHVRRKANPIADGLANIGMDREGPDLLCQAPIHQMHPIFQRCQEKALAIDNSLDGVILEDRCQEDRTGNDYRGANHVTDACLPLLPSSCI